MHWNFLIWFWACRRREVQPVQKPSALRTNAPLSTDGKIFLFPAPHGPSPPPPIFRRECLFVYCYNWFIAAAGWPFRGSSGECWVWSDLSTTVFTPSHFHRHTEQSPSRNCNPPMIWTDTSAGRFICACLRVCLFNVKHTYLWEFCVMFHSTSESFLLNFYGSLRPHSSTVMVMLQQ